MQRCITMWRLAGLSCLSQQGKSHHVNTWVNVSDPPEISPIKKKKKESYKTEQSCILLYPIVSEWKHFQYGVCWLQLELVRALAVNWQWAEAVIQRLGWRKWAIVVVIWWILLIDPNLTNICWCKGAMQLRIFHAWLENWGTFLHAKCVITRSPDALHTWVILHNPSMFDTTE